MIDHIVAVFETESAAEPLQRASEREHSLLRDWCGAAPELEVRSRNAYEMSYFA